MTISRRDFLKLSSFLTASAILKPSLQLLPSRPSTDPNAKNVLIILFDTLSARNINFYGYPRETMPNLSRLLERATVYHNHYASSNFTTPGTASLLTGRYPWEHLALKLTNEVKPELAKHSIFNYFKNYYRLAYTHNDYADILLSQFNNAINQHESYKTLLLENELISSRQWIMDILDKDRDIAMLFKTRLTDLSLDGFLYSLLFPNLLGEDEFQPPAEITAKFPRGLPKAHRRGYFILEQAIDWILQQTTSIPQPFLQYFHFLPPHSPYNTREDYVDVFLDDNFQPAEKPMHPVVVPIEILTRTEELNLRQEYDEYLLYVDSEFNRMFNQLDQRGVLDNTLIVFTSDHGEIFERNSKDHSDSYLFDPLVKIPLVIFEPGQTERQDIHSLTSCIDVMPTLLNYTGQEIPSELPGQILPPFVEPSNESSRTIYALDTRLNHDPSHITVATLMMIRENFKVIRYSNYAEYYSLFGRTKKLDAMQIKDPIYYEIFDLHLDQEELNNLALTPSPEHLALIDEIEQFYRENVEFPR